MKKKVVRIFINCCDHDKYLVTVKRTGDKGRKADKGRIYSINARHDVFDMLSDISNRNNSIVRTWIELSIFPTISMTRI